MDYTSMSLREKVLQTFIVTMREINRHGGPGIFFKEFPVAGLFYSYLPDSEGSFESGTGTNPARLAECRAASRLPLLVCADGCTLPDQTVVPSDRAIGAIATETDAYHYGKIIGMQMNANDIDWVLYPIVDLLFDRSMPLFAFTDDPALTARLCRAIIRGIQDQGVCATAKHFPGIGTCNINMHFGPGQNLLPFDAWMRSYGYIYQQTFEENVCSVMTTHMTFPAYQKQGENGYYPIATFSHHLTTELLKQTLHFQGAVVTDALAMGGVSTGDPVEEAVQAFRAGADLLLWPPVEAADRIAALLTSGEIPMSRLEDALTRIERLRNFRTQARQHGHCDVPDADFVNELSAQINQKGICLLRNKLQLLPLNRAHYQNILIVDATDSERTASSELLKSELEQRGFSATVVRNIYDVASNTCWHEDMDTLQNTCDLVIINVDMAYPTAWNVPYMLVWGSHMFDKQKKLIVNYGSAFFADTYFPEDPTYIEVNSDATPRTVAALADRILGLAPFTGNPVLHRAPAIPWN